MTVLVVTGAIYQLWLTHRIHQRYVGAGPKARHPKRMEKATYDS